MKRGEYKKIDNQDVDEEQEDEINVGLSTNVEDVNNNNSEKNTENTFNIRLKVPGEKEVVVLLPSSETTVQNVKAYVEEKTGTKVKCQRLVFAGRVLVDKNTVGSYNIVNNSILHLFPISEAQADANIAAANAAAANAQNSSTSSSNGETVPATARRPTSAQEEMNQQRLNHGNSFFSGGIHVENPALLLWRARVKIISIVCIFYFSLALMDEIPVIFGLEDSKNLAPYGQVGKDNILFMPMIIFGIISHITGIVIALHGIRATHTLVPRHALIFFKGFSVVIFLASINTAIETYVSYKNATSRSSITDDAKDAIFLSLGLDIFVRICLWFLCWVTARNYLYLCRQREASRANSTAAVAIV